MIVRRLAVTRRDRLAKLDRPSRRVPIPGRGEPAAEVDSDAP
jgi:hypothetical protein